MRKFWFITLLLVGLLLLIGTANAKYIPYVEEGDWGGITSPWQMPGGFSTVLYGRMGTIGDVDVVTYEFIEPTSNWLLETSVPQCGEHFVDFSPVVAVMGSELPATETANLPFELPPGMGAVMFDEGEAVDVDDSENYLFTQNTQRFTRYESDTLLPAGEYFVAIWEPNGHVGAYAVSMMGVHPDYIDAQESARMEEAFDLVNSGAWMGQDCNAPLAVAGCEATEGFFTEADYRQDFVEQWVVGEGYVLTGVVRDAATCLPITHARIWFWMANAEGEYDGEHEGMLFTNQQGGYRIQSEPPGDYGPEAHVHMHISAPGYRAIETEFMLDDGTGEGSDTFEVVLLPEG
jgi:hypothetical protein